MNPEILEIQQLLAENRKQFAQSVSQVEALLENEKAYTKSLIAKSEQEKAPFPAPIEPPPKTNKLEKIGGMSDEQLMRKMNAKGGFEELMRGW